MNGHKYTSEQVGYLTENVVGRSSEVLAEMFNTHFGLNLTVRQIQTFKKNRKLSSGLDGRFERGHIPFNKGKKGLGGWEPTHFKKGHKPHNYKPVGTERVNGEGYVDVKVADPNKWKTKHSLIWEKENGPVPKGYVIIFGDGNKQNFSLDNLILISRKQLALLNKHNLIQNDAELTKTGVILADLYMKIGQRKKGEVKK